MNKENEVLMFVKKPDFFVPATLSSLTLKRSKEPTIVNLVPNVPLQKLSTPGNAPASYPERPETTSILRKSQSTSLMPQKRALSSQLQQTGSNRREELPLQTRFQKDQQTLTVKKSLLCISQQPRAFESVTKNRSASMSRKSEDIGNSQIHVTHLNSLPKNKKYELMVPSKKQKLTTLAQLSPSSSQEHFHTNQKTKHFSYPVETFATKKKTVVSHWNKEEKQSYPVETVPASTQQVISNRPKQQTDLSFILGESNSSSPESSSQHFQAPPDNVYVSGQQRQPYELSSSSKEKKSRSTELQIVPRKHETPILQQVTSDRPKQQTGLPILGEPNSSSPESSFKNLYSQDFLAFLDTLSASGEQRQPYELLSSSKEQKSKSTELQIASKKHETSILEQVTSDCPKQQTGLISPILGEQKSSSPEFSLENNFSEDYMYLQSSSFEKDVDQLIEYKIFGEQKCSSPEFYITNNFSEDNNPHQSTRIEKDVDRLRERLKQFDEFICVKCTTKFTSQDELLRHEMIHFDD